MASAVAQDEFPKPSKESEAYHNFRVALTEPSYGLAKVKRLISAAKPNGEDDRTIPTRAWDALSVAEKFTFSCLHAETFSQNCDAMPPVMDEHKKIFGWPESPFVESSWSERQVKFFANNRAACLRLLEDTVRSKKRMGCNLKLVAYQIHAKELFPFFISTYQKDRKDRDILSLMMVMMNEDNFVPFQDWEAYPKLYGTNAYYGSYIQFVPANESAILRFAADYAKQQ